MVESLQSAGEAERPAESAAAPVPPKKRRRKPRLSSRILKSAPVQRGVAGLAANYLRFVWSMAGAATLTFYSLWAFSLERENLALPQLSVAPFVVALLRYAVDIDKGAAGEPETIVLGDRVLQALGVTWLAVFVASALVG